MKSVAFRSIFKVPRDIKEGMELTFDDGSKSKITKIKSIEFINMRTMVVIGLCKGVTE